MNKILSTLAIISPLAAIVVAYPAQAKDLNVTISPDSSQTMVNLPLIAQAAPDSSSSKKNYVGPIIGFGNNITVYGVTSKFAVSDNISVRPFFQFGTGSSGPVTGSISLFGATATYDFGFPQSEFSPYAGIGYLSGSVTASVPGTTISGTGSGIYFEVGTDYNVSDSIVVNANYKFRDGGYLSIGGGYRF